jgi:PII-like signaling protein
METSGYSVLKIYASTTDRIGSKLFYEHIVYSARDKGVSGVTVYRGIMGYGQSSRQVHSSRFWELTEKLPVMIEMVDKTEILEDFFQIIEPELENMSKGCLVSIEPIGLKYLKPGKGRK